MTQGDYLAVMGSNPSWFPQTSDGFAEDHPSRPVEMVTWDDATNYCAKLTQRERAAGRIAANSLYRLPTGHSGSMRVGRGPRRGSVMGMIRAIPT